MPSYSGHRSANDWVYAIEKDFKSKDGTPATYAAGQPAYYGDEVAKIQLTCAASASSLNADGTLLAVVQEHNIHIYSIEDRSLLHVLKGHISHVDALEFHPTEPKKLISCAMCNHGGSVEVEPTVVFWNLNENVTGGLLKETALEHIAQSAVDGAVRVLETSSSLWQLNEHEKASLAKDFTKSIETLNIKSQIQDKEKLCGRLVANFGSRSFNRDGSSVIFLPGERPRSNCIDDGWVICIWDTLRKEMKLTLRGHTDALMWAGFSPDDKVIASVSWDKTFRIWSHTDGSLLHTFHSNSQNWTGGFSPDSRFFAGTAVGQLWIWDVVHGVEVATHTWSGSWCRHLDWSPDGKQLIVAGGCMGRIFVFDVKTQSVVQERQLSVEKCSGDVRGMMGSFLEVNSVQYTDEGRKIVYRTMGDYGVEVYDFGTNKKWRFAPGKGEGGYTNGVFPLEKESTIASVDVDAVRFWNLGAGE